MQSAHAIVRSRRSQSQILGVVLLLLVYMAQPVLAAQNAFCSCLGMESDAVCHVMESDSPCCAQKAAVEQSPSCCTDGGDSESVCHCPLQPVDSIPTGMVLEGEASAAPFAWWADLEAQANEVHWMAPHLGESGEATAYKAVFAPGPSKTNRGPTGPAAARLCRGGLIAFLADLSVANL